MEVQLINFQRLLNDYALQCDESNEMRELWTTRYTYICLLSDFCVRETSTRIATIAASRQNVALQVK